MVDDISLTTSGTLKFTVLLSLSTFNASTSESVLTIKSTFDGGPPLALSLLIRTSPVEKLPRAVSVFRTNIPT